MFPPRVCAAWLRVLSLVVVLSVLVGCGDQAGPKSSTKGDRRAELAVVDASAKMAAPMKAEAKKEEAANTNSFTPIAENRFVRTDNDPLSTFSIDVDTASYSILRRFLATEKKLPPKDAVRIEELINYFPYSYLPPKAGQPVGFTLELASCPWNPAHHLVRIGLAAKQLRPEEMPPRNLVFLVDTSGSMDSPNRLPLLQTSLKMLVEQLTPRDRVALVAYAGSAGLVLPSTPGSDKPTIHKAIDRLKAGGSTNGGQGIQLAYQVAKQNFMAGGVNRVILGTDGDFNVGIRNPADLTRLIEEQRKSGIFLTILGFGMGNLKDSTLEKLAHHGNGHYAYVDDEREARKVFVEQGAALVTVAKDVKLQIEFNPKRVAAYRLIGYENRVMAHRDFQDDRKDAGDLGSGHTVTALYELIPPGLPVPGAAEGKADGPAAKTTIPVPEAWLTVNLRYKDPEAETSQLLQHVLTGTVSKAEETTVDFRFAASVAAFGMLLRESAHKGDATYGRVKEWAKPALGDDPGGHRASFLELIDLAAGLAPNK